MSASTEAQQPELYSATLVRSQRITPETSKEEVRHLIFRTGERAFACKTGQSIRVMAPGQYGNKFHVRLYTIADPDRETDAGTEFTLCVRRCFYVDEYNGEQYKGVASNYLCDLPVGASANFAVPFG